MGNFKKTRILLCIVCILAIFSFSCASSGGGWGNAYESVQRESQAESKAQSSSAEELFLSVVQSVENAESFYTQTTGKTSSLGITQQISARRYVLGEAVFKESISYSGFVKVANQTYVKNDKYLLRKSKKISSQTNVTWADEATDLGREEYLARYGSITTGLSNYLVTKDTILSVDMTEKEGEKIFEVVLDNEKSTVFMAKEMKTNASSKQEPTFSLVKLIVTTTSNLTVLSVKYECRYKIKIAVLGNLDCKEETTENFYAFNQNQSFSEESFFNEYL